MLLQRRSASRAIPANERRAVPHAAARTLGADKKSHGFNVRQRQFVEIQRGGTTTVREFGARMLDVLGPHVTDETNRSTRFSASATIRRAIRANEQAHNLVQFANLFL